MTQDTFASGPWRWLVALACMAVATGAQAAPCTGRVFVDSGLDGADASDRPVAGAKVSDGVAVAVTDAAGRYRLDRDPARPVFVVKPPGTWLGTFADAWRPAGTACGDFAVGDPEDNLHWRGGSWVLVLTDPQVKSARDVDYFRRDVLATMESDWEEGFGISTGGRGRVTEGGVSDVTLLLGDIVDDVHALYAPMREAMRMLEPILAIPGNHDADMGATSDADSLRAYAAAFGPDTYAWEESAATYVMLDDVIVRPTPDRKYVGGLREDQFAFLEAYLPTVPRDRLLVVGLHIPLFEPDGHDTFRDADRERLFALLREFDEVLVLSGHSHAQRHYQHDATTGWHGTRPLHEYNVGAASGAYWSGVPDAAGIPDATMADGTPNGHASLRWRNGGGHVLAWHPARTAADDPLFNTAMALHAPRVLRRGSYPAQAVYANVWMGRPDTRVEWRLDGGTWRPMARVLEPDPRLVRENVLDDAASALRAYDRAPPAEPSHHLWRATLPTDLPAGEHRIEVRALDPWHGWRRGRTSYELVERTE